LASAGAKLGAAVSTTSLEAIEALGLTPSVFNNNADAVAALKNKQIDGIVVDLPTAFYLAAVEIDQGVIVGQIDGSDSGDQGFGLLLSKPSPQAAPSLRSLKSGSQMQPVHQFSSNPLEVIG
jgi:polar amino acid transport system substrate-binding protein